MSFSKRRSTSDGDGKTSDAPSTNRGGGAATRSPVDTVVTFGHGDRIGKTEHWGLSNLSRPDMDKNSNRNKTFSIPSALSSERNMMLQQPNLQQRVKMLACSTKNTLALLVGGAMFMWGEGMSMDAAAAARDGGGKGRGADRKHGGGSSAEKSNDSSTWPHRLAFNKEVISIAAGHDHFAALTEEPKNNLYTWGENQAGQLGHGDNKSKSQPKKIISWKRRKTGTRDFGDTLAHYVMEDETDIKVVHVACSYKFTLCVTNQNRMFGWGKNKSGQLGLSRAVTNSKRTKGVESSKRQKAFLETYVLWPVELAEMKELGYKADAVVDDVDQAKLVQLMVSVGSQHATSWMHLESLNMFSESFRQENERLKKRIHHLESKQSQVASAESESHSTLGKGASDVNSVAAIPRRVTDEPTLIATGKLLTELHTDLLAAQAELIGLDNEIQKSDVRESDQQVAVDEQELNVTNLWKMVENLEYDQQTLEESQRKQLKEESEDRVESEKKDESSSTTIKTKFKQLILAKNREAEDKKTLARNGRAKLADDYNRLNTLSEKNTRLQEKRHQMKAKCKALEQKVLLLNELYIGHDKLIRRTYVSHNKQDVFDLAATARLLFQKIRTSDVAGLASNRSLVEKMTRDLGHQPGIEDLVDESNRRLVDTMMEAEDTLDQRIGVTDARRELADLLKEALHDMVVLRRQNNTYVSGILSQARSKLDTATM